MKANVFEVVGKTIVYGTAIALTAVGTGIVSGTIGGLVGAAVVEKNFTEKEVKDLEEDKDIRDIKNNIKEWQDNYSKKTEETENK